MSKRNLYCIKIFICSLVSCYSSYYYNIPVYLTNIMGISTWLSLQYFQSNMPKPKIINSLFVSHSEWHQYSRNYTTRWQSTTLDSSFSSPLHLPTPNQSIFLNELLNDSLASLTQSYFRSPLPVTCIITNSLLITSLSSIPPAYLNPFPLQFFCRNKSELSILLYRHTSFYSISLILRFIQIEGLWKPCIKQI